MRLLRHAIVTAAAAGLLVLTGGPATAAEAPISSTVGSAAVGWVVSGADDPVDDICETNDNTVWG